jgi:tetratricopeptide (TPR) repeat protein
VKKNSKTKGGVITSIGEITLPTYRLLGENRNPVFHSQYGVAHIYPYTLQDEIAAEPTEVTYRTLNLENEYLRVSVLPDLGGRVYSVYDKVSEHEVFYKNDTIKFSPLAIRGAFFSGGLEFSFPVAHAPTTADPVNWEIWEEEDGSASIMIGGLEHMGGMRWSIKLSLYPNRCALSQDVWLHNPTPIPGRYHYWTNASLDSDDQTEFIYPLQRVRSYEFAGTTSWPVARLDLVTDEPGLPGMEGVPMWPAERMHDPFNFRWEKNMLAQVSIFGRDVTWDYFGAWRHSTNTGYAHFARYQDVSGMKLWSWGQSEVGIVNQTALMDDGSLYAETQCGAMETQLDFDFLPPGKTRTWREWWLPLRHMGGLTCASEDVGAKITLSVGQDEAHVDLNLGICPVYPLEKAGVELSIPGKVLLDEKDLAISPQDPWLSTFSMGAKELADKAITLRVTNDTGQEILTYTHHRDPGDIVPSEAKSQLSPTTAEDYYSLGLKHENFDNRKEAVEAYQQALEVDNEHGPTHFQLGMMLLRSADFTQAKAHFQQAANLGIGSANYYLGLAAWYGNDANEAKTHYQSVPPESSLSLAAKFGAVKLLLYQEDWGAAIKLLRKATPSEEMWATHTLLLGLALRRAGEQGEAAQNFDRLLSNDPINLIALRELCLIERENQKDYASRLTRLLVDDKQYVLDLASFYLDAGLLKDALDILEALGEGWDYAMTDYLGAYICHLLDDRESLDKWLEKAQANNPDKVFPSRLWEVRALHFALEQNPKDDQAKYFLGNFLYAHHRYDEAISLWEEGLAGLQDFDVIYRNLGLGYWQQKGDLKGATQYFEKALSFNPKNQDLYMHLDNLYRLQGQDDKRTKMLAAIKKLDPLREDLRKRYVAMLVDLGQHEKALKILIEEKFVPLEMDQSFHLLYVRALLQRAEASLAAGDIEGAIISFQSALEFPENHGVGPPITMGNAEIFYRLGCAYELLGEYHHALQAWQEAAKENHNYGEPLYEFVQMSLDKLGRYSELGFHG